MFLKGLLSTVTRQGVQPPGITTRVAVDSNAKHTDIL